MKAKSVKVIFVQEGVDGMDDQPIEINVGPCNLDVTLEFDVEQIHYKSETHYAHTGKQNLTLIAKQW